MSRNQCQIAGPDCYAPSDELGVTACDRCDTLGCAACLPDDSCHAVELVCPTCDGGES